MNWLFRVIIKLQDGLWVYDDRKFGVREQQLVFGMNLIGERMIEQVGGGGDRFNLIFSSIPFPGSEFSLGFVREETEGFVYCWEEKKLQGWLSPSLRNYFPEPPPEIYLQLLSID